MLRIEVHDYLLFLFLVVAQAETVKGHKRQVVLVLPGRTLLLNAINKNLLALDRRC